MKPFRIYIHCTVVVIYIVYTYRFIEHKEKRAINLNLIRIFFKKIQKPNCQTTRFEFIHVYPFYPCIRAYLLYGCILSDGII